MRDSLNLALVTRKELRSGELLWAFEPRRGLTRCLSRALWSLLHKLGCLRQMQHVEVHYTYERTERDRVTESVRKQVSAVMERGASSQEYCILMGGIQFAEAMMEFHDDLTPYLTVPAGQVVVMRRDGYRAEMSGFPVHVVPHLDGVALVPKVLVERLWDPVTGTAI